MSTHVPEWHENAAGSGLRTSLGSALWGSRDLISILALRDLRVRYKQAVLGVVWVLVQPIASVVVFTLVFSRLAGVTSQGVPYPVFALLGMVMWTYFSSASTRGSEVLVSNPALVTKVYFPRVAAPASAMLPPVVDLAISMLLVVALLLYYGVAPTWRVIATPLWLVLLIATAFGVALWLSALNVRYRDVQHAVGPVMQIWFFASPVAYSSSDVSKWSDAAFAINPIRGILDLARWSVLDTPWPGWSLGVSVVVIGLLLGSGLIYFRRAERAFADVI